MQTNNVTRSQIIAIINTYEGMLRINWDAALLARRTEWLAVLAKIEGR